MSDDHEKSVEVGQYEQWNMPRTRNLSMGLPMR